jgi:hypothetical protein
MGTDCPCATQGTGIGCPWLSRDGRWLPIWGQMGAFCPSVRGNGRWVPMPCVGDGHRVPVLRARVLEFLIFNNKKMILF